MKVTVKQPSTEEWKRLYTLMSEVKEIGPWEWFEEDDIFAVQDPKTEEIGFVSIMGAIGEHYSIAVYRGEDGLRQFWDFQDSYSEESDLAFQKLIEIPQIQASFEDREYLFNEDREIIKKLDLNFRGKGAWPMFRSYKPGFVPWFINSVEAQFLINVLEQTIDVSLRFYDDADILYPDNKEGYLLRKCIKKSDKVLWQDCIWHESQESPNQIEFISDMIAFEKLKSIPNRKVSLEIDIFMSPHAVHEKGEKPYYPYILILLETKNGMILGHKLIPPLPNLQAMWQKMPSILANILIKISFLPDQIYIASENLYQSLNHLNDYLNSSIKYVEDLVIAPEARKSFINFKHR
jgi:hypothetical protein